MNEIMINEIEYQIQLREIFQEVMSQVRGEWLDHDYVDFYETEEYKQQVKDFQDEFGDGTDGFGNYIGYGGTDVFDMGPGGYCDF